jgi:Domain of unknown function (DUF4383)
VTQARTPAQLFALAFGAAYLLVGVVAFSATGFEPATGDAGTFIIFPVNLVHNLVHIAVGALLIGGSRTHESAKLANLAVGVVYGLVTVLGAAGLLEFLNIDDLASPDNFLHLVTSALALYFATAGAESAHAGPA